MIDTFTDYAWESPEGSRSKKVGTVVVETISTNRHCRYFHARKPIQEGYCIWDRGKGITLGELNSVTSLLSEIEGVEGILLSNAYTLMISKGHAFDWPEVEPGIISVIEQLNAPLPEVASTTGE